jgi:hypothetical protein
MSAEFPKMLCVEVRGDDDVVRILPLRYRPDHPSKQGYVIFYSRAEQDQFSDAEAIVCSGEPEQHSAPAPTWPYSYKTPLWLEHLHQHSNDRTP